MTRTSSVPAGSPSAADIPALDADTVAGRFSLLAWRSVSIRAQPGLVVYVRGGVVRVREGGKGSPRIVGAGACFAAHRHGRLQLSACTTNAELAIEWPGARLERLSPGLEPVTMEPMARAPRP